jgi:hypothetical protein
MSVRNRPKATPRRKAGSKASKAKRVIAFRLVVEAQPMLVRYEPYWSSGEFGQAHFEFRSASKKQKRIPVSETGYLSHFALLADVRAARGPERYAKGFVLDQLNRGSGPTQVARERGQLAFF